MKLNRTHFIALIALAIGIFIGVYVNKSFKKTVPPISQLKLQEILSIKELHLVKHHYHDLFFLHRKNDPSKSIRAVVQIPVSVVAYLDLKAIRLIRESDTIRQVILPRAQVHAPTFEIGKMTIRKTRSLQLYAGKDLYPEVSAYLATTLSQRMDSIYHIAIENKIIEQAESEAKEYLENTLRSIGRSDVIVSFGDPDKDKQIQLIQRASRTKTIYLTAK